MKHRNVLRGTQQAESHTQDIEIEGLEGSNTDVTLLDLRLMLYLMASQLDICGGYDGVHNLTVHYLVRDNFHYVDIHIYICMYTYGVFSLV